MVYEGGKWYMKAMYKYLLPISVASFKEFLSCGSVGY